VAEYRAAEEALAPAQAGVAEREAQTVVAALGAPHGAEPKAYAVALVEALSSLPADLVRLACKRARTTCRFPPRPGEVLALINGEMMARADRVRRAKTAGQFHRMRGGDRPRSEPLTEEQRDALEAKLDEWRKVMAMGANG
jgi:hypothetical protein